MASRVFPNQALGFAHLEDVLWLRQCLAPWPNRSLLSHPKGTLRVSTAIELKAMLKNLCYRNEERKEVKLVADWLDRGGIAQPIGIVYYGEPEEEDPPTHTIAGAHNLNHASFRDLLACGTLLKTLFKSKAPPFSLTLAQAAAVAAEDGGGSSQVTIIPAHIPRFICSEVDKPEQTFKVCHCEFFNSKVM